jgi:hypothetical protein
MGLQSQPEGKVKTHAWIQHPNDWNSGQGPPQSQVAQHIPAQRSARGA